MGRLGRFGLMAALASASAVSLWGGSADAPGNAPNATVRAFCRLQTKVVDVRVRPGALIARIELFSSDGHSPLDAAKIEPGIYIHSVAGTRLPEPSDEAEGISEVRAERTVEDETDVRGDASRPNGVPEAVVRFDRPSDGDPKTQEDGDAGDVLAMLTDVPDGRSADVCLAGKVAGSRFVCCDSLLVRNRGLRDLPPGMRPKNDRDVP